MSSNQAPLNSRPAHLETDQDLLRDQLNYFRTSHQSPPSQSDTSTSSCLQPIKERVVPKTARRRPRSKHPSLCPRPFPQVSSPLDNIPNRFARKSQPSQTQQYDHSSISEQVRGRVQSMSIEQIRAAQQEIHDTLKPESLQILNKLWRRRHHTQSHPNPPPVPPAELSTPEKSSTANQPPPTPVLVHHPSPLSTDAHTELLIPAKAYESDEEERNKRAWMTGADEPIASQAQVDQFIDKAMRELGPVGKMRFALTGAVLSSEEIRTLPTHLGLHHHGSSPASAGYTLPDILVLMRSTVVTQRVMAFRMLKCIVLRHREHILPSLVDSGTLTSVLSPLVLDPSVHAAITNQSAYLELVEALVGDYLVLYEHGCASNLYFGSNFFSPCPIMSCPKVINLLAHADVAAALVEIARATAVLPEHVSIAERSLQLVRLFVTSAPDAPSKLLQNRSSLLALKSLASTTARYPKLYLLSCDVLASIVVSLGWRGGQVLEQLQLELVDDRFLHSLSSKMVWLLDSDIEEITEEQSIIANGVLRLIRGALTFERGINVFAALTHVVCRLVRTQATAAESYLTLEAYSHALFVQASSPAGKGPDKTSSANVQVNEQQDQANQLTTRRLSDLIPIGISAISFFVDANAHSEESRAAAGHFGATLFTLTSYPLLEEYVIRILNVCSESTKELAELVATSPKSIKQVRFLSSVSHATARLLSKVKVEDGFVEREIRVLFKTIIVEEEATKKCPTGSAARIVANACAEWIGVYSRVGPSKRTVEFALELLPRLTDARVKVDLLSRTLLNAGILRDLSPKISDATAQKCGRDLIPVVMTELTSPQKSQGEAGGASCLMSFEELCNLWITNKSVFDSLISVLNVLFECGLLEVTPLFECLLQAPVSRYSDCVFELLFKVAQSCFHGRVPLIASLSKTVLSSLSTTVNSPIADSALSLCDFLLSRGPVPTTSTYHNKPDFLSSVLTALMCGPDIHNTLRASMWKRTVDDCGGATLYQNAIPLGQGCNGARTGSDLELENMLRMFGVSIAEGYLDGERCPLLLRNIIFARIETALSTGRTTHDVFELMACSVRSRSSLSQQLVKLMMTRPLTTIGSDKLLLGFQDEVKSSQLIYSS